MVKRILLLLVSLHTLQSSDAIIILFPSLLTNSMVNGKRYSPANETTVGDIVTTSKEYYLKHMSPLFNETVKDAIFYLTASYLCMQPSFNPYEDSKPLAPDSTIDDMKKKYRTDRFSLKYGSPKKTKRKRLVSTQ